MGKISPCFTHHLHLFLILAAFLTSCIAKNEENSTVSKPISTPSQEIVTPPSNIASNITKLNTTLSDGADKGMNNSNNVTSLISEPPAITGRISSDAMLRGFYVFIGIGAIVMVYIAVKTCRLRRHRALSRYKVISRGEDTESFFPLAGEEDEDEEIFNAASTQQNYS